MSHHEDGGDISPGLLITEEDRKSARIKAVGDAITYLKTGDITEEQAMIYGKLLLSKVKTPETGIVFDS